MKSVLYIFCGFKIENENEIENEDENKIDFFLIK